MERGFRPQFEGRATSPAFYKGGKPVRVRSNSSSNALGPVNTTILFAGLTASAVGIFFYLRSQDKSQTGAALTVIPSEEGDLSTIQNMNREVVQLNHYFTQHPPSRAVASAEAK
jgi:hypothetical protein